MVMNPDDCDMYMGERGLSFDRIDLLYRMCEAMDAAGNSGVYAKHTFDDVDGLTFAKITDGMTKRDHYNGILFYSSGWGWRLRKNPHWRDVFFERFPAWKVCRYDQDEGIPW